MRSLMKEKVFEVKRNMILEGVTHYFEEVGFYSATMQEIAKHLGLSVGALYKFFPSKEELFYAYIDYQIQLFHASVREECEMIQDPKARLEVFIQRKFESFIQKRSAISDPILGDPLFFVKLNASQHNPAKPIFDMLAGWFELILEGDKSYTEQDAMKLAYLFNASTSGYVEYWLNGGTLPQNPGGVVESFFKSIKGNS